MAMKRMELRTLLTTTVGRSHQWTTVALLDTCDSVFTERTKHILVLSLPQFMSPFDFTISSTA